MTIRDLDATILAAVARLAPDAYGVTIRECVGELLGETPSIGAVHLALTKLERQGRLRARTGNPTPVRGGRAKRLFTLTAAGARSLSRAQLEVEQRLHALKSAWKPA